MEQAKKRFTTTAFDAQWARSKEDIRLAQQGLLEALSLTTAAGQKLDSIYEGVTGREVPDLTEMAS